MKKVEIKDGIFYIDGKPVFLISADYPYYRDDSKNWDDRLKKIKGSGIDTVTFYIPWRHHMLKANGKFVVDFRGATQANRDVKAFIKLCAKNKLWMIVKPGPFIHAEVNFGGLPDWVSPEEDDGIEPFLNSQKKPIRWGKILPAPLCGKFKAQVKRWYALVDKNIIKDNVYPKGNIIAVQICNEGIYSNAPSPITEYDYSPSSEALYRKFAKSGNPFKLARWPSEFMRTIYSEYSSAIKSKVPFIININPPAKGKGLDDWLARIIPENWPEVNYGFTNWLKPVSEDASSFERYSILAKRRRGINLEENWGFSKLYDKRFQYPVVCVFETLLAIANGATGFNAYTGVNTSSWDDLLDNTHDKPYPDSSPIKEDGSLTNKYAVLNLLARFFKENGVDFLSCKPDSNIAWGLYPPYACLAAAEASSSDKKKPVKCGHGGLDKFQRMLRSKSRDFQIVNIESASSKEISSCKNIVLRGGPFMDRKTQGKLLKYTRSGGRLIFVGAIPSYDENFIKYDILKEKSVCLARMEEILKDKPFQEAKLEVKDPAVQVWCYENTKEKIQFLFVLSLSSCSGVKEFRYSGRSIKVALPRKSAAVIKLKNSRLQAVFVKGINEMSRSSVAPEVSFGADRLKVKVPCDLLAQRKRGKWQLFFVDKGRVVT